MTLLAKLWATCAATANYPLRRGSRLKAIFEFGRAQLAARAVPGQLCVPFPNDTSLVVPPRMKGAAHFIHPGLCEFEQMAFVAHFLRPGDCFVDVGANLGAYTLLASAVARSNAIAIEPCQSTFQALTQTVRLNGLDERVTTLNLAIGAHPGTVRLTQGLGTENFVSVPSTNSPSQALPDHQAEVPVSTLDLITEKETPTFLKVDVEGFESEVIAGGTRCLQQIQGAIIERAENAGRYGFDESKLHQQIRALGFKPFTYAPFDRMLQSLPEDAHGNIIYLRDPEAAAIRLKNAPTFTFRGFTI